jgi:hypothetical protein
MHTVGEILVLPPLDLEVVAGVQVVQAAGGMEILRRRGYRRRADPAPLNAVFLLGRFPAVRRVPIRIQKNPSAIFLQFKPITTIANQSETNIWQHSIFKLSSPLCIQSYLDQCTYESSSLICGVSTWR